MTEGIYCPECGEEHSAEVKKCRICGVDLETVEELPVDWEKYRREVYQDYKRSNAQPLWLFAAMITVSCGTYLFYWFYRNYKHFKIHYRETFRPILRTLLIPIPILGWIGVYDHFSYIRKKFYLAGIEKPYPTFLLFFAFLAFLFLGEWYAETVLYFLKFLSYLPLFYSQWLLNQLWAKEQPGLPVKARITVWEVFFIAWGILVWAGLLGLV